MRTFRLNCIEIGLMQPEDDDTERFGEGRGQRDEVAVMRRELRQPSETEHSIELVGFSQRRSRFSQIKSNQIKFRAWTAVICSCTRWTLRRCLMFDGILRLAVLAVGRPQRNGCLQAGAESHEGAVELKPRYGGAGQQLMSLWTALLRPSGPQ